MARTSVPSMVTRPGGGLVEPRHEVGEGALAGAARADEGADGAGGNAGDLGERGIVAIGERDQLEGDVAAQASDWTGAVGSAMVRGSLSTISRRVSEASPRLTSLLRAPSFLIGS
jgi:hypothetical protein